MDRATDGWPSRVQDWSYCCEPRSTDGWLCSSRVTTSRRRTIPFDGRAVLLKFAVLVCVFCASWLSGLPWSEEDEAPPLEEDAWVIDLPGEALRMMSANSSGSESRPRVLMVNWNCWPRGTGS